MQKIWVMLNQYLNYIRKFCYKEINRRDLYKYLISSLYQKYGVNNVQDLQYYIKEVTYDEAIKYVNPNRYTLFQWTILKICNFNDYKNAHKIRLLFYYISTYFLKQNKNLKELNLYRGTLKFPNVEEFNNFEKLRLINYIETSIINIINTL